MPSLYWIVLVCLCRVLVCGAEPCDSSLFGCCSDGVTAAGDEMGSDCPQGVLPPVPTGQDIELLCLLPDVPHSLSWKFVPADESLADLPPTASRFETSVNANTSTLSIKDTRVEDSGTYVCEALLTETGEITANHIVITVIDDEGYGTNNNETTGEMTTTVYPLSTTPDYFFTTEILTTLFNFIITDDPLSLDGPPVDLEVFPVSRVEADGSVEILIRWRPPTPDAVVDLYTIYHSTNKSLPLRQWTSGDIMETSMTFRVKTELPIYFTVAAINSQHRSPLSDIVVFYMDQETGHSAEATSQNEETVSPSTTTVSRMTSAAAVSTTTAINIHLVPSSSAAASNSPTTTSSATEASSSAAITSTRRTTFKLPEILLPEILLPSSTQSTTTAHSLLSSSNKPTSKPSSAPEAPTNTTTMEATETTTATNLTGCLNSLFGCCDDGMTAASGANKEGCASGKLPAPRNFQIERTAVASDRVGIHLSWDKLVVSGDDPITEYTIRFTDDRSLHISRWRGFTLSDIEYDLALRTGYIYYFTVLATTESGVESELSPLYKYNPTELRSSRCMDSDCLVEVSCHLSRYGCCEDGLTEAIGPNGYGCSERTGCSFSPWGCCSNGLSTAAGPHYLGCIGDPQPCDITQYGCCPDGVTAAQGDEFEGCSESIKASNKEDNVLPCTEDGKQQCQDLTSLADICRLPSETGSCANYAINWYYDISSGSCRRFWYGGCEGNSNRFKSRDHCEAVCVEPPGTAACYLSPVEGRCAQNVTKWYYDAQLMTCKQFQYGGCVGNNNNFASETDCVQFCQPSADESDKDICSQPMTKGLCRGSFPRWWYNRRTGNCEQFIYSGCHGNENRFVTKEFCDRECKASNEQVDMCTLSKDAGPCLSLIPSWYYDSLAGSCTPFYYGGCGGNRNRFTSLETCQESCVDGRVYKASPADCLKPALTGTCSDVLTRYSYDPLDSSCKPFVYSGCGQNENSFSTQNSCELSCAPAYETDHDALCMLPEDVGTCSGDNSLDLTRWRYDSNLGVCIQFLYSGCGGNRNNFLSLAHCVTRCEVQSTEASAICLQAKSTGNCDEALEAYYYSPETGACSIFTYSGCGGNSNRFTTEVACQSMCGTSSRPPDRCPRGVSIGECDGMYPRWYYNHDMKRCETFIYSGCKGSANNFLTMAECEEACTEQKQDMDVCALGRDDGMLCEDSVVSPSERWFYDRREGSCQQFTYFGCQGNKNRFTSKEECTDACPVTSVCSLAEEKGPCTQQVSMYRYDIVSSQCVPFTYSGCGGNANRYETRAMCEVACLRYMIPPGQKSATSSVEVTAVRQVDRRVCFLPVVRGPCTDLMLSYFYDSRLGKCTGFVYSGCEGNANRFFTLDACRQHCIEDASDSVDVCGDEPICYNSCPDGFLKDGRGCSTCQCVDLCRTIMCSEPSTHCVVQRKNCDDKSTLDCVTTAEPVCIEDGTSMDVAPYITRPHGFGSQYVEIVGGNVVLPCHAFGSPKPVVAWYKHRRPLVTGDRYTVGADYSLTIRQLQASDKGEYICRAFNQVGDPAYEYLTLTIHEGVLMLPAPVAYTGTRGSNVTIPCKVTGFPKPTIRWINNATLLPSSSSKYRIGEDNSLTVYDVTADDAGDYVCLAKNQISSSSKSFTLKIKETLRASLQDHNTSYTEGDTLSLACITQGFPPAKVEWLRNDEILPYEPRISITAHTLEVTDLVEDDSGFYTCMATNEHEALSLTTSIEVKTPASVVPDSCTDTPELANCQLIVYYDFCSHPVYRHICCRSCELDKISRL